VKESLESKKMQIQLFETEKQENEMKVNQVMQMIQMNAQQIEMRK